MNIWRKLGDKQVDTSCVQPKLLTKYSALGLSLKETKRSKCFIYLLRRKHFTTTLGQTSGLAGLARSR
jgi:hypothetical protein